MKRVVIDVTPAQARCLEGLAVGALLTGEEETPRVERAIWRKILTELRRKGRRA